MYGNRRNSKSTSVDKYSCLSWGSSSEERDPEMSKRLIKIEAGVWPDLVGQTWFEAEAKIRNQFPNITIQVLPQGTFVQKEFSPDRVQVFVDGEGKVVKPPAIG